MTALPYGHRVDWRDFDTRVAAYAVIVDDADRLLLALWNGTDVPDARRRPGWA